MIAVLRDVWGRWEEMLEGVEEGILQTDLEVRMVQLYFFGEGGRKFSCAKLRGGHRMIIIVRFAEQGRITDVELVGRE